jgi:hypothetical protein
MKAWEQVPESEYDSTWCVTGRCIDSETREMVGPAFPDGINDYKGRERWKRICNIPGEKHSCRKTEILRKFPFPVFEDSSKLVPNMAWTRINAVYDQWCVNDAVSVYYQNSSDSLAKSSSPERLRGYYYYAAMVINDHNDQFWYNQDIQRAYIDISRCGWRGGKKTGEILKTVNSPLKKLLVLACMPVSVLLNLYTEHIRKFVRKIRKNGR